MRKQKGSIFLLCEKQFLFLKHVLLYIEIKSNKKNELEMI